MSVFRAIGNFWQKTYRPLIYTATLILVWLGAVTNRQLSIKVEEATSVAFETVENLPAYCAKEIAQQEEKLALMEKSGAEIADLENQRTLISDLKANKNGVLLICFDFDPGCDAELGPQVAAILRHCFSRGVKVIMNIGGNVMSQPLAQQALDEAARDGARLNPPYPLMESGKDYVFLGFRPNAFQLYLQMGESIVAAYETDYAGRNLSDMPIMQHIKDFRTIDVVVDVSAYVGAPETWIAIGNAKFKKAVILGMGAIGASDYYPFLQSKQIAGLLPGVRGAAEYETALKCPGAGSKRMWSQLYSHVLAIFLILLGNVEFFFKPKRRKT